MLSSRQLRSFQETAQPVSSEDRSLRQLLLLFSFSSFAVRRPMCRFSHEADLWRFITVRF